MKKIFAVFPLIGGIFICSIMVLTCIDIIGRYLFNSPLEVGYDLTGFFLLIAVACGIVIATELDQHIAIDSLYLKLPPIGKRVLTLLVTVISAVVFAILVWQGGERTYEAMFPFFEKTQGTVGIVTFPFRLILAIGFFFSLVALIYQITVIFRQKDNNKLRKE
jgi:TRAP-type C4-dicarboxylate transport system permease small subunit